MDASRTVRTISIVMSALFVLGILYLAVGERAGPNAGHWAQATERK